MWPSASVKVKERAIKVKLAHLHAFATGVLTVAFSSHTRILKEFNESNPRASGLFCLVFVCFVVCLLLFFVLFFFGGVDQFAHASSTL